MDLAPVALFVYNRPWHTQQTVEALRKNGLAAASELFVFSDGPRSEADREHVRTVREYAAAVTGFRSVTLIAREQNLGLARSIIGGVTEVVNRCGRIIVLEDDMVTSPYFLRYMNEALELYQDEERVVSIHGYVYPVKTELPETFFIRGADCWGWATWERGWAVFEPDGRKLLHEIRQRKLQKEFDMNGSFPYTRMLENQIKGKNDSWAIRWYASAFLKDKLTLYPRKSLIQNIGVDSSGTHCGESDVYFAELASYPVAVEQLEIKENKMAREAIERFHLSTRPGLLERIISKVRKNLKGYCNDRESGA